MTMSGNWHLKIYNDRSWQILKFNPINSYPLTNSVHIVFVMIQSGSHVRICYCTWNFIDFKSHSLRSVNRSMILYLAIRPIIIRFNIGMYVHCTHKNMQSIHFFVSWWRCFVCWFVSSFICSIFLFHCLPITGHNYITDIKYSCIFQFREIWSKSSLHWNSEGFMN